MRPVRGASYVFETEQRRVGRGANATWEMAAGRLPTADFDTISVGV
jgi:hypothetical protein